MVRISQKNKSEKCLIFNNFGLKNIVRAVYIVYGNCVKRFPEEPRPSLQRIRTFVKETYKCKNVSKILERRQQELIEYFEEQIKTHNIKNFL